MEPKKVQKQARDERTQEDYPTSAKIHTRCRVVFWRLFELCLMKEEEEEERRKRRRKKMNKIEFFKLGFLDFAKC